MNAELQEKNMKLRTDCIHSHRVTPGLIVLTYSYRVTPTDLEYEHNNLRSYT